MRMQFSNIMIYHHPFFHCNPSEQMSVSNQHLIHAIIIAISKKITHVTHHFLHNTSLSTNVFFLCLLSSSHYTCLFVSSEKKIKAQKKDKTLCFFLFLSSFVFFSDVTKRQKCRFLYFSL